MNKKSWVIIVIIVAVLIFVSGGIWFYYNSYLCGRCGNSDEQLVGGCAGVYYPYWNECCQNWANDNSFAHDSCLGNWTVEDNTCKWICSN
ncbi:MAG: hypothetical protein ABH840_01380 [Nanoarchaeota archaeon]